MFSFFKRKKEKVSPAPQLIVRTDKEYEKKVPTISEERITLSVNELLDGKYTYAQLLLENFFYVNEDLQKKIAKSLLQTLRSLSAKKWYAFSGDCRGSEYYSHSNYLRIIQSFDEELWNILVKNMTIMPNQTVVLLFKGGTKMTVEL